MSTKLSYKIKTCKCTCKIYLYVGILFCQINTVYQRVRKHKREGVEIREALIESGQRDDKRGKTERETEQNKETG